MSYLPKLPQAAILVGLLVGSAAGGQPLPSVEAALDGRPCQREVEAMLDAWNARGPAIAAPPAADGAARLRIPTNVRGDWIVLELPSLGPVSRVSQESQVKLMRLSSGRWLEWSLDSNCRGRRVELAGAETSAARDGESPAALTDEKLIQLLAAADAEGSGLSGSVVYVWSPHMPLSVEGYREISQACRDLSLQLIPTLFSDGDLEFARRQAVVGGIPEDGLQELRSAELLLRDAQLHAPTILVFQGDRVSTPLPGYRNALGYRKFLSSFLRRR